ncbi:hypothetical protein EHS25_003535 [Saitozyma podzolica]|uniref:Vacuolar protein sorting-associated protein 51 homolog n=1 Tax=Saitozyma podzolica TaxID=1890683 RepID=A0A427Y7I2_9TREE|nr:hypothetical protein EHS25_003535 [Saitozyma podzolica]
MAMNPAGPSAPSTPVSAPAPTRRGSALSAGGSVEQRRARREQLREFYGLKGDATTPVKESGERGELGEDIRVEGRERRGAGEGKGNGKGKGKSEEDAEYQGDGVDPLDIDSRGFDATKYYEDLIARSSLSDLMQRASALSSDVGNLQSSRHSLVYNHHHQLFSAGDTISILNSRTPQLLSIVAKLQDSFSSISQLVDAVALSDGPRDDTDAGKLEARVRDGLERLRLMVIAEEPPENIRTCFEGFRADVEALAEGNPEWDGVLQECRDLVEAVPPGPSGELQLAEVAAA